MTKSIRRTSWLWATGFLLATAASAWAGPGWGRGGRGDEMKDRPFPPPGMVEKLKLTDDQVKSLKALHEKHRSSMEADRKALRANRDALRDAMEKDTPEKDLRKLFEAVRKTEGELSEKRFAHILEVRKVLTPEQRKEFRDAMDERFEKGGPRGPE
jgi:Spy/CpxP family protein refolding chaperone